MRSYCERSIRYRVDASPRRRSNMDEQWVALHDRESVHIGDALQCGAVRRGVVRRGVVRCVAAARRGYRTVRYGGAMPAGGGG